MAARRLISVRLDGLRQKVADPACHGRHLGVLGRLHGGDRIDGANLNASLDLAQKDIAVQHRTRARLDPDGLMCHLGVAGPQVAKGRHLDVELLLRCRLGVALGQDAKAMIRQACRARVSTSPIPGSRNIRLIV